MDQSNNRFRFYKVSELVALAEKRPLRTRWGDWKYIARNRTLELPGFYYVDLDRCRSSAEILDWIFQIQQKNWATSVVLANLLHALHDLLNPQGNYCGAGRDKRPDVRALLRARRGA
jgi:hypothetical protein